MQTPLSLAVPERRTDLYCVVPGRTDRLCKLRGGERLQIKTLMSRIGLLECWDMALDAGFPLDVDARRMSSLMLGIAPDAIALESAAAFEERLKLRTGLPLVAMHKTRRQSTVNGIKLEATLARVSGMNRWTIALEGSDPVALKARVRNLGLSSLPNRSYATWLATLAGRTVGRTG